MFRFEVLKTTAAARRGRLHTPRGVVDTPAFMPVATVGSVKGVTPENLREIGTQIVLANAYHLYLRPGIETVRALGGLSRFMAWNGPVLTDSGGYQAFSLSEHVRIEEKGVRIRSHLDGALHELTPEKIVGIQESLGVDIMMPLDDCAPYPADPARLVDSVERTGRWLERSANARASGECALFGIVQGGTDRDLRARSVESTLRFDLPGIAVGGLSVGEPHDLFHATAAHVARELPSDRPRYLMGAGSPQDLIALVSMGYDLFDCVLPTRNGRNGTLFTSQGRLNIRNARFARDSGPADPECGCPVCAQFSRAYLRHLSITGEILASCLNSIHNLAFYQRLMREMREALERGEFPEYTSRTLSRLSMVKEGIPR